MRIQLLFCVSFITIHLAYAQSTLPILRAHATSVTIRDGINLKKNFWGLDPKAKPDTYYTDLPRANGTVTFITDVDSLSFETRYGEHYDFVILLNGKDSCYTRIETRYSSAVLPERLSSKPVADTIPFTMRGSRPYVTGTVNGHAGISMMLDLGAGITCVNASSVEKAGIDFNATTTITNTDGTHESPSSTNTTITLGNLTWRNTRVVEVHNVDDADDMIIGNSLFRDAVLEIDYDKKVLIVHHQSAPVTTGYTRYAIQIDQDRPKIKIDLLIGGHTFSDWFLFDTGRDGTMLIGEDFTGEFDVWDRFETVFRLGSKKIVIIPAVTVGGLTFDNVVTNANDPAHPTGKQSLLGNEVLRQFNVILDNRSGYLYLKPNSLQGQPYERWADVRVKLYGAIAGVAAVLGVVVWLGYRLFKRRRRTA